jgi:hypothetical protein
MSDINVRSDSVDVEQIMRQIRARIREKRGADYTEAELQQLATVKLEKFLDPRGLRSDLVEQYRRTREVSPAPPNYAFGEDTLYETHRGLLRSLRTLFRPLLKVFFNPDKITTALHIQSQVNTQAETRLRRLEEREPLSYELMHNLTVEVTRLGIEVHNLKMRVESLSSRLDFDERRARSLEGVVQYKPAALARPNRGTQSHAATGAPSSSSTAQGETSPAVPVQESTGGSEASATGVTGERRRRRRRRRRRPGATLAESNSQRFAQAEAGDEGGSDDYTGSDTGDGDDSSDDTDAPGQ